MYSKISIWFSLSYLFIFDGILGMWRYDSAKKDKAIYDE